MALIGFGNANIFSIILSQVMLRMPNKKRSCRFDGNEYIWWRHIAFAKCLKIL